MNRDRLDRARRVLATRPARALLALLLAGAAAVAGLAWAHASPLLSDPDGDYHLASIWCPPPLETSGCRVTRIEGKPAVYVPEVMREIPCYATKTESAACIERVSRTALVPSTRVDSGDYPGPYYRLMHRLVTPDVDATVLTIRTLNVALAVGAWALALLVMPRASRPAAALALAVGVVPLGMFVVSSVNPSAWSFTGLTTCWLALHALATADGRGPRALAAVLAVGGAAMAAAARGDTFPFVVIMVTALALVHLRRIRLDWIAAAALAVAVALWSFLSAGQAGGIAPTSRSTHDPGFVFGFLATEVWQVPTGVLGVPPWGALGWGDVGMPTGTYVPLLLVAGHMLLGAFGRPGVRRRLALAMVCAALLVLPFYMLARNLDIAGIQPRYFMSLVPFALFLAQVGPDGSGSTRLGRWPALLGWVGVAYAHASALLVLLHWHTAGNLVTFHLGHGQKWWWTHLGVGPLACWIAGSAAFALAAASIVVLHRRPAEDDLTGHTGQLG